MSAKATNKKSPFRKVINFFAGDTQGMTHYDDPVSAYAAKPKMWIVNLFFVLCLILAFIYACFVSDIFLGNDRPISWDLVGERLNDFVHPDWSYFFGYGEYVFKESVVYYCLVTLGVTILGTTIGFLLSIPFGFFASHKLFGKWANICSFLLIAIRTFPELLLALFFVGLAGQTCVTALLCLSIHSIGMIGKLYADQLDELDLDALEAMDACGANAIQRVHTAVVPEIIPSFLSVGLYRFDINLRTATMLGLVLNQSAGVGYSILLDISKSAYSRLGADTLAIIVMIVAVDLWSSWLRKKLV